MSDEKKLKLAPVTVMNVVTTHSIPVQRVIDGASAANLKSAIVIGYDENGEFYFASSEADGPSNLWDLEMAKKKLLEAGCGD